MKRTLAFILAVLMLLPFTGCTPPAGGSHPRLFVVASHSLLGVLGRDREDVLILEEDDFGRVMFAYVGHTVTSDRPRDMYNILAVLIAQRTTRRYSYFYDGINVILHEIDVDCGPTAQVYLNEAFIIEHFSEEQLEQLKEDNSWNEELNEDRFFRVRVATGDKTRHMTSVPVEVRVEAYFVASGGFRRTLTTDSPSVTPRRFQHRFDVPLTMDRNGNVIYFIRGGVYDAGTQEWTFYPAFLFMFDRRGNLIEGAVMELTDLWDYRDQLQEFKELNGWSFSYR